MKTIEYNGWIIDKVIHPKLQGRYSVFDTNGIEYFRANTIKEARIKINHITFKKSLINQTDVLST